MRTLVSFDDFLVERVAQPVVDRVGAPLREQVRFFTAGAAVASIALAAWKHRSGKLDAADAVFCGLGLVLLGSAYATAWGLPIAPVARNPNRVAPLWRVSRLCLLCVTAAMAAAFLLHLAAIGWDTQGALILAGDTLYTATLYAAACDDSPPPAPKALTAPAGA